MKYKYELPEFAITKNYPQLRKLQEEMAAAGARVVIAVYEDVEIEAANIKPSRDGGRCSNCARRVFEVSWTVGEMKYSGLACRNCHEILEYGGVGPLNWTDLFN